MNLDFLVKVKGLEVSVSILSKVPADLVPVWDFGVEGERTKWGVTTSTYLYETSGHYYITLHLTQNGVIQESVTKPVLVSGFTHTCLSDTIYNLIDKYIPDNLNVALTPEDKAAYIQKWQLYLAPLVNHCIPLEEYSNELYYEGLENQLVMELAVYDYLYIKIQSMLIQTADQLERYNSVDSIAAEDIDTTPGRDRIKQITTGPTEVQYYDTLTESISALFKSYATATQPGGILDDIRKNLCMLANRLNIFLPICNSPRKLTVPKVVNHRKPGKLGGPNPGSLVNYPKDSIL